MQPFKIMDWFSEVPPGNFILSLDHDEGDSEADTILTVDSEVTTVLESGSEASTIPGEIVEVISLDSESSSEVELIDVVDVETHSVPHLLSPEQENEHMREHERFGHFHRVERRHLAIQGRLRRISEAIASESPSERQVRRRFFHDAVHGR